VNISGGGIGVTVSKQYDSDAVLLLTVRLPDHIIFKACVEVAAIEPSRRLIARPIACVAVSSGCPRRTGNY